MRPATVYLILEFGASFAFSLVFTVSMLYQVTVVQLTPLQLVLVGTSLEATIFLFEIPTGLVADTKSRRLSVIIGYGIIGLGFVLEGSLPYFGSVVAAQVLWGLGYTFTSGATEAWVADEIGAEGAGQAYLRGSQAARTGALIAIPFSVWLGISGIQTPIVLGGMLMVLLSAFLGLAMTESGFRPRPPEERSTWAQMQETVRDARRLLRRQPVLGILLAIGLFYGLYSEGFDRLWTPHLLDTLPHDTAEPVIWFGVIRAVALVLGIGATEVARRSVDTRSSQAMARVLKANAGLIVLGLVGFGLSRSFWVALALYWVIDVLRSVTSPLQTAWLNLCIDDPQVRATLFSVSGQVDAIGQIAGGPGVGAIGNLSIRAALVTSGLILSPVLPLYALAMHGGVAERSN
jgi:MFS transporter, DHA3 family, tetracycline resistance protein